MNQNALMAGSILLMLSVVVLTPFFFTPETPVIFYENPALVLDYLNTTDEFRIYVSSISINVRFQAIYLNLTNLTTNETVSALFNNTCTGYANTTWHYFELNVTVILDENAIYDAEFIIRLALSDHMLSIFLQRSKETLSQEIHENDLPFPLAMERRW